MLSVRYLQAFEDINRKLGSTTGMCDLVSLRTSSSANTSKRAAAMDSHRSHQLFKGRYLTPNTTTATPTSASSQKKVKF